jgi:hypothetical protein
VSALSQLVEHVPLSWGSRRRGLALAAAAWLLFALDFSVLTITTEGDSRVQFTLVRRLLGAHVHAVGYQFGLAIFEVPFYALGRLLAAMGIGTIDGAPSAEACVALGAIVVTLGALLLTAHLVTTLGLPLSALSALAATFGMPLFFYGTWEPGKSHAWDTFLFAAVLVILLAYVRSDFSDRRLLVALALLLGFSATVRYFSAPAAGALAVCLVALRRFREAVFLVVIAALTWGLLLLAPVSVGAPLTGGGYDTGILSFDPLGPLKMLVTDHRGLFVWSPIALMGVIGYMRLLLRGTPDRRFLVLAAVMAVAILLSYAAVPFWDGTWSFSQRFLTPFTPLVAIGVAGLARDVPRTTIVLASAASAWTVFLALNLQLIGPPHNDYTTIRGGAFDVALEVTRQHVTLGEYAWAIRHRARLIP